MPPKKDHKGPRPRQGVSVVGGALTLLGAANAVAGTPTFDGAQGQSALEGFEGWLDGDQPTGINDALNNLNSQLNPLASNASDQAGTNLLAIGAGLAVMAKGHRIPVLGRVGIHTKHHFFRVT